MPNPNLKCSEKFRRGTMAFKECRIKEKNALKKLRQKGNSQTKINRAKTSAAKAEILKKKKDAAAKRVSGVAKSLRTKSVNVKGDRRLSGDNVKKTSVTKINKTKNVNKNKNTSLTNQQKQKATGGAGGGGGMSRSRSNANKTRVKNVSKKKQNNTRVYNDNRRYGIN